MSLSDVARMCNVADHIERLKKLLDAQAPDGITQRIFRARTIVHDEYVVMTIMQSLPGHRGMPDGRIQLYVASIHSGGEALATLVGHYAVDQIVAFLGLDIIEAKHLYWLDETPYSSTHVDVDGMIRNGVLPG